MTQSKWDQRYLDLAVHISKWSKDPRKKVGAIVTKGKYIVGIGYNGFPKGIADTKARLADPKIKIPLVLHAETNALTAAQGQGDTIYVNHLPCTACFGHIIQHDIKKVLVVKRDYSKSKWNSDMVFDMAKEANIQLKLIKL